MTRQQSHTKRDVLQKIWKYDTPEVAYESKCASEDFEIFLSRKRR